MREIGAEFDRPQAVAHRKRGIEIVLAEQDGVQAPYRVDGVGGDLRPAGQHNIENGAAAGGVLKSNRAAKPV